MFDAGTTEIRWKLNARASRVTIRCDVFSDFGEYHVASKFGIKSIIYSRPPGSRHDPPASVIHLQLLFISNHDVLDTVCASESLSAPHYVSNLTRMASSIFDVRKQVNDKAIQLLENRSECSDVVYRAYVAF